MSTLEILKDLNLKYRLAEDLRECPESLNDVAVAITRLKEALTESTDYLEEVKILGQIGGYCRITKNLNEAAQFFDKALLLVEKHSLGKKLEMANRIRRAHVHQWQGEFEISNLQFDAIVEDCLNFDECKEYLDFAYQHRGKNYLIKGN